jgi:putative oxidoreductase
MAGRARSHQGAERKGSRTALGLSRAASCRNRSIMHNRTTYLLPLARLLMSSLFIWDGVIQLRNPAGTIQYFTSVHVPIADVAVWVSIAIHLLGGLALLVGFKTPWAAGLLALLCLGTAFGVHLPNGDQANMINFYKNLAMTGGLLYVVAYGAGGVSVDEQI